MNNNTTWKRVLWLLAGIGFVVGLYGLYARLAFGHTDADYGSYIPWGLWVAGYVYLIGLSAGAFLLSTLVYVLRVKVLEPIGRLALFTAVTTLIGAMILIFLDLGHPERAWRLALHTNFRSIMGWMIWLYTIYFILLLVELWFATRADLVACSDKPGWTGRICRFLAFGSKDTSPEKAEQDRK
ncbi:MAG: NrfD/PsrC family molybdoenzyme membrane anchor subunit, partial [Anaerolineae bacterium]